MADKEFTITHTQGEVYLNNAGRAVNGYRVDFVIPAFNEGMAVQVESLKPDVVTAAILEVVNQRKALANL